MKKFLKRFVAFIKAWWAGVAEGGLKWLAWMIPGSIVACAIIALLVKDEDMTNNEET